MMYNQSYNTGTFGGGFGADYQQQYYYQPQNQSQHTQQQKQQMIAGIMGYYSPDSAAMFYNPYSYGPSAIPQQIVGATFPQQQLDYQLTPALYLLNQQAELLQKSLNGPFNKLPECGNATAKPQRKQRGPYKRRTNKTLSPVASPASEFETDTERLSSSDVSCGNTRSTGYAYADATVAKDNGSQQKQRKRRSDSSLELEQQTPKQTKILNQKQSIFRDVAMMAVSSCTPQKV